MTKLNLNAKIEAKGYVIQEEHVVVPDLGNLSGLVARISPDEGRFINILPAI
jgi:hypothetical protein